MSYLFNRNIIPLSVFLDEVMKLLSCHWMFEHRPNTGKRRNSYIESVCYVLLRICILASRLDITCKRLNRVVNDWNRLDRHGINAESIGSFKRRLDQSMDRDDRWNG